MSILDRKAGALPGQSLQGFFDPIPPGYEYAYGVQTGCAATDTLDLYEVLPFGLGITFGPDKLGNFLQTVPAVGEPATQLTSWNQIEGGAVIEQSQDVASGAFSCQIKTRTNTVFLDGLLPDFHVLGSVTLVAAEPRTYLVVYVAKTDNEGSSVYTLRVAKVEQGSSSSSVTLDVATDQVQAYPFNLGFTPFSAPDYGGVPAGLVLGSHAYIPNVRLLVNLADCTAVSNVDPVNETVEYFLSGTGIYSVSGDHAMSAVTVAGAPHMLFQLALNGDATGVVVLASTEVQSIGPEVVGSVVVPEGGKFWFIGPNCVSSVTANATAPVYEQRAGRSPNYSHVLLFSFVLPPAAGLFTAASQVNARVLQPLNTGVFAYPSLSTQGTIDVAGLVARYEQRIKFLG